MFQGNEFNRVATSKYLGVNLCDELTCNLDFNMVTNVFIKHFKGLHCNFNNLEHIVP